MVGKHKRTARGISLIEVITASAILAITVLGTLLFRYTATVDIRRAEAHGGAGRVALLLSESWAASGGNAAYDPIADCSPILDITASDAGPAAPGGFTSLGSYRIRQGEATYFATLAWQDVASGLRELSAALAWQREGDTAIAADAERSLTLSTRINH
jgi:hypothetical protein